MTNLTPTPLETPAPSPLELRVSMISLGVLDMPRSIHFYQEKLGLQLARQPGELTLLRAGK